MKNIVILLPLLIVIQSCASVKSKFDFDKVLWTAEWNPHKELFAIGGNWNEMQFISADDLKNVKTYELPNTITKIKWNETNNVIAVASQFSQEPAILINTNSDEIIKLDSISKDGARGLGWNYDSSLLGVGDYDGNLILFSSKGDFLKKIKLKQKAITGISWHPTKNIVVAVGSQISIYNMENNKIKTLSPRKEDVLMLCVEWHKSGDYFVTGDYGDFDNNYPPLLQYWKQNGAKIKTIKKSKTEYRNLRWSSDGKTLATVSDKLRLWDTEGELIRSRSLKKLIWGIDWNMDDTKLVVTTENGEIILLNDKLEIIDHLDNRMATDNKR